MSSFYNSRPRMAEGMVKEDQFEEVRERETVEEPVKDGWVASFP